MTSVALPSGTLSAPASVRPWPCGSVGHKTAGVYRRYRIVNEAALRDALERTHAAIAASAAGSAVVVIGGRGR
jgi:hypothetical protein